MSGKPKEETAAELKKQYELWGGDGGSEKIIRMCDNFAEKISDCAGHWEQGADRVQDVADKHGCVVLAGMAENVGDLSEQVQQGAKWVHDHLG